VKNNAWITGASSGIGRALALRLAGEGMSVAATARSAAALDELVRDAKRLAGKVIAMPLDVTDAVAVAAAVAGMEKNLGPLELVVLNAGTHHPMSADDFSLATTRQLMEVNYFGVVSALEALLPRFIARGRGTIAVVASLAGYRGLPTAAAYGPSKAALINLCESLKLDLDRHGVDLSVINPGFVRTPLTDQNTFPMPFLISADEAVDAILAGLRRNAFEITFPRRFAILMKMARLLPYSAYFALASRTIRK
jgi:short-subunit dehydrogenase